MSSLMTSEGPAPDAVGGPVARLRRGLGRSGANRPWLALAALGLGLVLAILARARPAYDASGWLVWANQTLHGHLNLDAAPSWKPLTYLATLPYSLSGHTVESWLLTLTTSVGGVAAALLAGRLAWQLAPRGEGWMAPRLPALMAAVMAAGLVATMTVAAKATPTSMGYLRQVLIDSSDPTVLALWLAAIDRLVARRIGVSLGLLCLAGLGRPEVWVFLIVMAVWIWFRAPRLRVWAIAALAAQPVAWFVAPALTSHSFLSAGNLDLNQATALSHSKLIGVFGRVRGLTGTAGQVEVGVSLLVIALVRDRRGLALAGLALTWTLVEVAFALHGWSAVPRYLIEVGGLLAVVGGLGLAHLLAWSAGRSRALGGVVAGVAVLGLALALVPFVRHSVEGARTVVAHQRTNAAELSALRRVVDRAGGPHAVLRCGTPLVDVGWQASLAWELGRNVGEIGFGSPPTGGRAFVAFRQHAAGWQLAVQGDPSARPAGCSRLEGLHS